MTEARYAPERRQSEIDGTSATARLARIESKLDSFTDWQIEAKREIRELHDWRIEMNVYLRQLRWTFAMAGGALIVGVINILIELVKHT